MSKFSIGIDIGLNSLKMVEIEKKKDKYYLKQAVVRYYDKQLCTNTADRKIAFSKGLKQLQGLYKLAKHRKSAISLPVSSIFVRYVNVMETKRKNEKDILAYEAREQIPMPLDEVAWDYSIIERKKKEKKAILIAVKKENVDESIEITRNSGFKISNVSLDLLNLLNIVRNNKKYKNLPGVIIIDIGSDSTGILISRGEHIWLRNFTFGGKRFTESIEEHCAISFDEAERVKIDGPDSLESADQELLGKIKESILFNLETFFQEVERSISFYKIDQLAENEINQFSAYQVILTGGGAKLNGLVDYFKEKMELEVSVLNLGNMVKISSGLLKRNQFDSISVSGNLEDEITPLLSVAIGAAIGELRKSEKKINLMGENKENVEQLNFSKIFKICTYILFFGAFVIYFIFQNRLLDVKDKALIELETVSASVESIAPKLDSIKEEKENITKTGYFFYNFLHKRFLCLNILNKIAKVLPKGVWINNLQGSTYFDNKKDNEFILQGKAVSYDVFDKLILSLKNIDLISSVKPESITGKESPFNFLLILKVENKRVKGEKI